MPLNRKAISMVRFEFGEMTTWALNFCSPKRWLALGRLRRIEGEIVNIGSGGERAAWMD